MNLEELGLEACKGTANAEVHLLAGVHGQGLVLVGEAQVVHRMLDVLVSDSTEVRSEYCLKNNYILFAYSIKNSFFSIKKLSRKRLTTYFIYKKCFFRH